MGLETEAKVAMTMEVEYDSANSGCSGAFERRRETSTMEERLFGGKWETWDEDGVPEGTCVCAGFKHFLHVQWNDGSPLVKFRFTGREGDRFWFDCEGAISAVFNGGQITWDDGCIWKPAKSMDIMSTTNGETILEPGVKLPNDLGNDGVGIGISEKIACNTIHSGSGTWNDTNLPHDRGDTSTDERTGFTTPCTLFQDNQLRQEDSTLVDEILAICPTDLHGCERSNIIANACESAVIIDKERPTTMHSGSDTNISSDVKWEFLIKSYTDPGYGISTEETAATCHDKDQDVDSGATYCFYLHGYFDLAKEWESKLQGYNELVKEWESKLQGYNEVSYQLYRPWKRPRFG